MKESDRPDPLRDEPVTDFLERWKNDQLTPADQKLMAKIYQDVRVLAKRRLYRENNRHFDTTDLANECFLRLLERQAIDFESRGHFFGAVGHLLRQILVDLARHHGARKREVIAVPLDEGRDMHRKTSEEGRQVSVLDLDTALQSLGVWHSRRVTIVNLRFFGGMTVHEIAGALQLAPSTVKMDWKRAKAFLQNELSRQGEAEPCRTGES